MNSEKITYLLGAGASAGAIPVVEVFNEEIELFLKELKEREYTHEKFTDILNRDIKLSKLDLRNKMHSECKSLLSDAKKHLTIDTFARKLYLTHKKEKLRILKALVSSFLIHLHFKRPVDPRYDIFFATLFDNKTGPLTLPDSINIISWNYDFQIEQSASPYLEIGDLINIQDRLNIYPNRSKKFLKDKFGILKLNGTAAAWIHGIEAEKHEVLNLNLLEGINHVNENPIVLWDDILTYYYWMTYPPGDASFSIKFAWENDKYAKELRQNAKDILKQTTHLVIIGYSFPTFNRTIDKELLESMDNVKKITIQNIGDNVNEVNYRFTSLIGKEKLKSYNLNPELIRMNSGKEEFYIPFEFIGQ